MMLHAALDQLLEAIRAVQRALPHTPSSPAPSPRESVPTGSDAGPEDLALITWLHEDVSSWPVTAQLRRVVIDEGHAIELDYDGPNWPTISVGASVNATPWIIARVGSRWYAATWEWLRPRQSRKTLGVPHEFPSLAQALGPHIKRPPLATWVPASGELVGFLISAPARDAQRTVEERSNVVWVRWP